MTSALSSAGALRLSRGLLGPWAARAVASEVSCPDSFACFLFSLTHLQCAQCEFLFFDRCLRNKLCVPDEKKRLMGQPDIGLRFRTSFDQDVACSVYTDSALHNADADIGDEGLDDEWFTEGKAEGYPCPFSALVRWYVWLAQDNLEKTEAIPISFMTSKSKASKRTILPAFGVQASACRDALDVAEHTRALFCEVADWRKGFA